MSPATEPVRLGAAIIGLSQAVLACLAVFGVIDDPAQIGALQAVLVALVALGSQVVRSKVTPVVE